MKEGVYLFLVIKYPILWIRKEEKNVIRVCTYNALIKLRNEVIGLEEANSERKAINNKKVADTIDDNINGGDGTNGTNGVEAITNNSDNAEALTNINENFININVDGVSVNFNISKLLQQFLSNS